MTAQELKRIREQLGWSQVRLAAAVGVSANSVARQERGELGISEPVARLVRLINVGVDVEAIAHTSERSRAVTYKPSKGAEPRHSKNKGGGRPR